MTNVKKKTRSWQMKSFLRNRILRNRLMTNCFKKYANDKLFFKKQTPSGPVFLKNRLLIQKLVNVKDKESKVHFFF